MSEEKLAANFYYKNSQGKLKTHIETVLPLAEVKKAHELSKAGPTRGKIILRP